ncbi:MAG TPA: hypothetical protein ENK09_03980 [Nitrospirae bacterium]|nr:hypothetical protein [Nitrospirota bacterium]
MLLTRPPLGNTKLRTEVLRPVHPARLACVRHAASVRSEPGSNSHPSLKLLLDILRGLRTVFSKNKKTSINVTYLCVTCQPQWNRSN